MWHLGHNVCEVCALDYENHHKFWKVKGTVRKRNNNTQILSSNKTKNNINFDHVKSIASIHTYLSNGS